MKHLGLGFSLFGFIILALLMIPNIVWAIRPPMVDVLSKNASNVPFLEYGEKGFRILLMLVSLFLVNKSGGGVIPNNIWSIVCVVSMLLYWLCWVLYYAGCQNNAVIYAMVLLPVIGFFSAGIAESVYPISIVSVAFLVFHIMITLENFPILKR